MQFMRTLQTEINFLINVSRLTKNAKWEHNYNASY